ncbi:MAG TPA: YbjN domain-containing protein [Anaerolineae bacterium]
MLATIEDIAAYVERYGWRHEERGDGLLVTGFRGKNGVFRIFVQIAEPWLLLAIVPFVPQPTPPCRERFSRYALRLNFEMNLPKIGADPDGDVALTLELRGDDLRYEDLAAALDSLSFYADRYYQPLLNLGRDLRYQPPEALDLPGS